MVRFFFNFKMRMSSSDWDILSGVMTSQNKFYRSKAQRDWFFNQVNRFCREIAIPFIESHQGSARVEKTFRIEEMSPTDAANVAHLTRFAEMMSEHQYCASNADWLFKQLNTFCREIATPFIESYENPREVKKVAKKVAIQEIPFADSTNIDIVRRFAALKQKSVSQIIQKYIVDAKIITEEKLIATKKSGVAAHSQ